MNNRFTNDPCGCWGKASEEALKEVLGLVVKVARPGRTDLRKANVCYEVKTGAGELGDLGGKLIKGSSMVIYIPVVDEEKAICEQEGFVMPREVFLDIMNACGLIREKTSTAGVRKVTIQTFYNRKQKKPHGLGLARMLEAFYNSDEVTALDVWLEGML